MGRAPLPAVDGRSRLARRHKVLASNFAADLGGLSAISHAERALIDQAAVAVLRAEQLRAALLRGEAIETNNLVRLTNAATRILTALSIQRRKRQPAHIPLRERLGK